MSSPRALAEEIVARHKRVIDAQSYAVTMQEVNAVFHAAPVVARKYLDLLDAVKTVLASWDDEEGWEIDGTHPEELGPAIVQLRAAVGEEAGRE